MLIIGCDFHTRYQQIAMAREETGNLGTDGTFPELSKPGRVEHTRYPDIFGIVHPQVLTALFLARPNAKNSSASGAATASASDCALEDSSTAFCRLTLKNPNKNICAPWPALERSLSMGEPDAVITRSFSWTNLEKFLSEKRSISTSWPPGMLRTSLSTTGS
jgi:hypothetical protein